MTDFIRALRRTIVGALLMGVFVVVSLLAPKAQATTGINQQVNFQGRLLTSQGATVPDGYYNIQFKIYQDGTGTVAGNPSGTLKWTESWLNNDSRGVQVKNGYMSVQLGSITSLSSVDWNQDTLWLSINIGNTNTTCTPFTACSGDGEMLPMKRLSSTPYSLNSGMLGGLTSAQFLQLAQGVQTEAGTNTTSIAINKTGTGGNFLNLQASSVDVFKITNTGDITFGSNIDHAISVSTAAASTTGKALTISAGTAGTGATALTGGTLTLQGGNGGGSGGNGGNLVLDAGAAASGGTGGTITIGGTNASSISLGQNTTLSSGKSLTISGGTTGTRPASPTEGMIYYDTTTKQLLTYSNGKWQSDRVASTKIVAANNSSQAAKDAADYVATGTSDQSIINTALSAATGGKVYLMEGTYNTDDKITIPNNTTLIGAGRNTLIQLGNLAGASKNMIENTDQGGTTGEGVVIRDLRLDGNNSVNTTGTSYGIFMNNLNGSAGASARVGATIANVAVFNTRSDAIRFDASPNGSITNSSIRGGTGNGIYLSSSNRTVVSNNTIQGVTGGAIWLADSINVTVASNILVANSTAGIYLNGNSSSNTISANNLANNGGTGANNSITLDTVNNNQIIGNTIVDNGGTGAAIGIDSGSANNYLADNIFSGTGATSISDASTTTVYANQSRAASGGQLTNRTANDAQSFAVQNASGTNILAVDTTNSKVLIAGTLDTTTSTTLNIGTANASAITIGSSAVTTGVAGLLNANGGLTVASSQTLTNNGATVNGVLALNNFATGGSIGNANVTVDIATGITINQTTSGQTLTLPNPTSATAGRTIYISNIGPQTFTMGGFTIAANGTAQFVWNGTSWTLNGNVGGSGNFIQNQSASAQTASFYINGTGTAATLQGSTSVLTPLLDAVTSSTALSIGTSNASVINLNQNVTVAAGKSLTLAGGNTASRPASPTEGMLYYDTSTHQLLQWNGTKWVSDRTTSTKIVAASDSTQAQKDSADYVATGTNDQTIIATALGTLPSNGGTVHLLPGHYYFGASLVIPNNGAALTSDTVSSAEIERGFNGTSFANGALVMVSGDYVTVSNISFDGNNETYANSNNNAINKHADSVGMVVSNNDIWDIAGDAVAIDSVSTSDPKSNRVINNRINSIDGDGIVSTEYDSGIIISGNQIGYIDGDGIAASGAISSNTVTNISGTGIKAGNGGVVTGNTVTGATVGIGTDFKSGITISGNRLIGNDYGISLKDTTSASVTGNTISSGGVGINIEAGTYSGGITITGNTLSSNAYEAVKIVNNTDSVLINNNSIYADTTSSVIDVGSVDDVSITGNQIVNDGSGYMINISAGADDTALSNNELDGANAINNLGTDTIYSGQVNASGNYLIQPAGTIELMKNTNVTGTLSASTSVLTPNLDRSSAGTLTIGTNATNTTALTIGSASVTTTIQGNTGVTLNTTSGTASVCRNTSGVLSICDASYLAPTATNFIQNGTSQQASANFNISGTGVASTLQAATFDTTGSATLNIGTGNASALTLGKAGVATTTAGGLLTNSIDATSATTLTIGGNTASAVSVGKAAGTINLLANSTLVGTSGGTITIQGAAQATSNTNGNLFTLQGSTGNGTASGGRLTLQGGTAGATSGNGGDVYVTGGTATGTGATGLVLINTPTYQTATTDSACYTGGNNVAASCTISSASVNGNGAIIVGFSAVGQTATLPDPVNTLTSATGRVVYITASINSQDFTLKANSGGGAGIEQNIAMRKNTTATMIWNGADWTAAGASSSTTLQAAYDNTLQSAGGAELVVSKTSATNGLTIRDSTTNSVNGALLNIQSSSAANLFSVNSNVTEYATDAGAEVYGASTTTFPASTWATVTSPTSTVTRYTTAGDYIATGQGSVSVVTPATANAGVINTLSTSLTANMTYNVSFSARLATGTFTDMTVYYSINGTTQSVLCATGQTAKTSIWTKINCTFQAPSTGITATNAILIQQATGVARTFYVDNLSVTIAANYNYAADPGVDDTGMANWSAAGTASVAQNPSDGYDASSSAQVTTSSATSGVRNKLSINPLLSTLYRVSIYTKLNSGAALTDFAVRYTPNAGSNFVACVDYNTQIVSSSWAQITCYIKTDTTSLTTPYIYFTQTTASGTRVFSVDTFSMTLAASTTPNVQVGSGSNGGPTTLLTLDKGASAPIAANNDALLGSMYYDTTLGKLQCYEADGWGACGSSPDNIITISPEYTNAVMHGTGIGTMISDFCSDTLGINNSANPPAVCGTNETYNFYRWTSPQASEQAYSIYVTYQLPNTFKSFASGQTSLQARVDSTSNAYVKLQIYKNHSGLSPCGTNVTITTAVNTWQYPAAAGTADPSTCGFVGGDSIVFKITMGAWSNANAYVGNLNFTFSNK